MPIILVTGFGAFPGAPSNPSAAIVRHLGGGATRRFARLGIVLDRHVLPVVFDGAPERLAVLMARVRPDAVLHIGLAGRRQTLSVETRAGNFTSQLHADARRRMSATRYVTAKGAPALPSRVPAARLAESLRRAGIPARLSIDAGAYVCNQTLYLTLMSDIAVAGFIHVPRPRGRLPLARRRRAARTTLAQMVRGIESALLLLGIQLRRRA
ncbi:MAG: Peptidase pyroglutamyl peptidase [Hyphomicrobiales bacterium]|nr:Peptidase pyroglutamyl peptidase [Hyphomicrobiales bacterium]